MTFTQVECFVEAGKTGSFSRAGSNLYISQQTISRQIKAMEQELGFPLFQRTRSGVMLTESGVILYEKWKDLIVEYRSAVDKARDVFWGNDRKVLIGIAECGHGKDKIVKTLMQFNERYPDLEVEYEILSGKELYDALEQGRIHVSIGLTNEIRNKQNLRTIRIKGHYEKVGIIFANSHHLAKRKKIMPQHLAKETIGVLSRMVTDDHLMRVQTVFRKYDITGPVRYKEYNSSGSLQMALITGKCVTIMYQYITEGIEDKVQFRRIEMDDTEPEMVIAYKDEKYAIRAKNIAYEFEVNI